LKAFRHFLCPPEPFTVAARADSGITTFAFDLKGKRVNIGNRLWSKWHDGSLG
jgi:TRAP-type uncharacterized transport system substrate-binding protein